jgi:subtilisin family serine protease
MKRLVPFLFIGAVSALTIVGCSDNSAPIAPQESTTHTLLRPVSEKSRIPGSYIVVLKENFLKEKGLHAEDVANEMALEHGFQPKFVYDAALKGFAADIPDERINELMSDPRIEYIEPDQEVHTCTQTLDWGVSAIGGDSSSTVSGDGTGTVTGVRIYIIDTGIQTNHPDLNVVGGINYSGGSSNNYGDGNGHGTHVAGIAAARDNSSYTVGVAPGAPLYAVRVLGSNGSGTTSGVIAGVNWVKQQKLNNPSVPMVANMSLGGGISSTLDQAVNNCISAGVVVCVAAGNSGADASNTSPARVAAAITVGAFGSNNVLASWSNYGSVVDINAPGVSILSTYRNTSTATLSGTSMATPHVTGAAALFLSSHTSATPAQVRDSLVANAPAWITTNRANTTSAALRVISW